MPSGNDRTPIDHLWTRGHQSTGPGFRLVVTPLIERSPRAVYALLMNAHQEQLASLESRDVFPLTREDDRLARDLGHAIWWHVAIELDDVTPPPAGTHFGPLAPFPVFLRTTGRMDPSLAGALLATATRTEQASLTDHELLLPLQSSRADHSPLALELLGRRPAAAARP